MPTLLWHKKPVRIIIVDAVQKVTLLMDKRGADLEVAVQAGLAEVVAARGTHRLVQHATTQLAHELS